MAKSAFTFDKCLTWAIQIDKKIDEFYELFLKEGKNNSNPNTGSFEIEYEYLKEYYKLIDEVNRKHEQANRDIPDNNTPEEIFEFLNEKLLYIYFDSGMAKAINCPAFEFDSAALGFIGSKEGLEKQEATINAFTQYKDIDAVAVLDGKHHLRVNFADMICPAFKEIAPRVFDNVCSDRDYSTVKEFIFDDAGQEKLESYIKDYQTKISPQQSLDNPITKNNHPTRPLNKKEISKINNNRMSERRSIYVPKTFKNGEKDRLTREEKEYRSNYARKAVHSAKRLLGEEEK